MPKPRKGTAVIECNGHTLTVTITPGGRRMFHCPTWPDLAEKYDGCSDPTECIETFERRATAPPAGVSPGLFDDC